MKTYVAWTVAFFALFLASPRLLAQSRDLRFARYDAVPVTFDQVEMPMAPRAASEANITVRGTFFSTCARTLRARVENSDLRTHYVKAVAMSLTEYACSYTEREYVEQVSLGPLVEGEHSLLYDDDQGGFVVLRFTVER